MLVDTGAVRESEDFMDALRTVIDPADLRWIWLTHTDFDHIGSLHRLLEENERLRVITSFLGVGIMGLAAPLAHGPGVPGQPGADRRRGRSKPDRGATTGIRQPDHQGFRTSVPASSSARTASAPCWTRCPNAPKTCPRRRCAKARSSGRPWTRRGCTTVDRTVFASELDRVRGLEPTMVLSSHLPAAQGSSMERLLGALAAVPDAPPFVGPDQAALEQMLAGVAS